MTWHYKIIEEKDSFNEPYYALVEFYPNLRKELAEDPEVRNFIDYSDNPDAWGEPILVGESKQEIIDQLYKILGDLENDIL